MNEGPIKSEESKKSKEGRKCSICGHTLANSNKTNECFRHGVSDNKKEFTDKELVAQIPETNLRRSAPHGRRILPKKTGND